MKTSIKGSPILAACFTAFGQSAPTRTFEVASIKVRQGAPQWKFAISGTRLTIESYTLFGLLKEAYNLNNHEIRTAGAPPLFLSNDTLYDVSAKAEGDSAPTRDDFRQMLQSLLADRFQLKVHREMKEMDVYALVVAKNGPKFRESSPVADRPVIDKTGLIGTWNIRLFNTPEYKIGRGSQPDTSEISIFTAVQDQLGLRLEPQKAMVEMLVIDH